MTDNVRSPHVAPDANDNKNYPTVDAVATCGDPTTTTSIPNRKYPRANFHDYNGGTYFVTVCTKNKIHAFGKIYNNEMHLSPLGIELDNAIGNIASHYTDAEIPLYVIMPNHFHAIICINPVGSPHVATDANAHATTEIINLGRLNQLARLTVATCGDPTLVTHHANRLGLIVGAIKSTVTRFARRNNIKFGWQSRYYDHIIRGTHDGNRIAEYIDNNVARWGMDCFNK